MIYCFKKRKTNAYNTLWTLFRTARLTKYSNLTLTQQGKHSYLTSMQNRWLTSTLSQDFFLIGETHRKLLRWTTTVIGATVSLYWTKDHIVWAMVRGHAWTRWTDPSSSCYATSIWPPMMVWGITFLHCFPFITFSPHYKSQKCPNVTWFSNSLACFLSKGDETLCREH